MLERSQLCSRVPDCQHRRFSLLCREWEKGWLKATESTNTNQEGINWKIVRGTYGVKGKAKEHFEKTTGTQSPLGLQGTGRVYWTEMSVFCSLLCVGLAQDLACRRVNE